MRYLLCGAAANTTFVWYTKCLWYTIATIAPPSQLGSPGLDDEREWITHMLGLIVRRVLLMLLIAIAVSALLFFTVTQWLGSPAEMMLGQDASPQAVAALNRVYGFDQ